MQMESSQRKGVFLLALVDVFSEKSELRADSATDEECAQVGIDAVADDLEFAE